MGKLQGHDRSGINMNGYIQAEEVAEKWNISSRQVQYLCKLGRIEGAIKFGTTWAIPEDAKKPTRTVPIKPGRRPREVATETKTPEAETPKN